MIVLTPPAHLTAWSLQVCCQWEKMSPRLQTICTSVIWCLSLAVCFWGLRRVKYAWLQHGWLQVFFLNNKQMTWNLYLVETNRIQNWFFKFIYLYRESSTWAPAVNWICLFLLKWKDDDIYQELTHILNWCTTSYTNTHTHVCTHICSHP